MLNIAKIKDKIFEHIISDSSDKSYENENIGTNVSFYPMKSMYQVINIVLGVCLHRSKREYKERKMLSKCHKQIIRGLSIHWETLDWDLG
jgi:hypothetical protein